MCLTEAASPRLVRTLKVRSSIAAEFVFGHFGFRGATTALIAKKASIAKPHIYYYFEDKEDLYRAILERAIAHVCPRHRAPRHTTDAKTVLTRYIEREGGFFA